MMRHPIRTIVSDTKSVGWPIKVARSRASANTSGSIVLRAVTGAEPTFPVATRFATFLTQWHTAQMGANPDDDQPLWALGPLCIRRGINHIRRVVSPCKGDLFLRASVNEYRLALPIQRDACANFDAVKINVYRGHCHHIGTWVHLINERPDRRTCGHDASTSGGVV